MGKYREACESGRFVVSGEIGPPKGTDVDTMLHHIELLKDMVRGVMIESYLEEGSQDVAGGTYGRSITDPCLGWNDSEKLVLDLAAAL